MGQDPYIEPRGGRQSNFMSNHLALDGLIAVDNGTTRFRGVLDVNVQVSIDVIVPASL